MCEENQVVFQADEMKLQRVENHWQPDDLLAASGLFYLKDVVKVLAIPSIRITGEVKRISLEGKDPWKVMGVKKVWRNWVVRMTVFAPYYLDQCRTGIKSVPEDWDGNLLLEQQGTFFLIEVCKHIPFRADQLRYWARKEDAVTRYGIWKDPKTNRYVVDMQRFAAWIEKLWKGETTDE